MIKDLDFNALEAFFESIPIRMTFVDAENNIRAMNTEAWDKAGTKVEERVGNSILGCHKPETAEKVLEIIEKLKAGREKEITLNLEPKDSEKAFREIYTAIKDKEGNYLGTLHLMYDTAEERRLREELEALKASA